MDPVSLVDNLALDLPATAASSPLRAADNLGTIRRHLPHLPSSYDTTPLATSVTSILASHPTNLVLSHRAVAVLAHPVLCAPQAPVELPIVTAMERLSMSAAFQHTAMAALQNAATASATDRDAVALAVVSAMRHHLTHSGILLRGADLIAYHLNQHIAAPLTSTYRVASRIVVDTSTKLTSTPQGASTALLALVASARHASSLASFSGRPSSTTRFSRGTAASNIVDQQFAAAVTAAMARHPTYSPVQVLGCEVIRVAAAGASTVARIAAKELFSAGGVSAVLAALQTHPTDVSVVDKGLVALRSLLLGGGGHGRAIKPGLNVDRELVEYVARVADLASESIAAKDRDLSSAAAVLGMDVRGALMPQGGRRAIGDGSRLGGFGRRIIRRIRLGGKAGWYDAEYDRYAEENFTEKGADPIRSTKGMGHGRNQRVNGRSSFSILQMSGNYARGGSSQEVKDMFRNPAASARIDGGRASRKVSEGGDPGDGQITLNKKWRSVSGRWNQRGRRGSNVSNGMDAGRAGYVGAGGVLPSSKRERRGPLTLSGSEMANLTRQPSRIFGVKGEGGLMRTSASADPRTTEGRPAFVSAGHEDFGF